MYALSCYSCSSCHLPPDFVAQSSSCTFMRMSSGVLFPYIRVTLRSSPGVPSSFQSAFKSGRGRQVGSNPLGCPTECRVVFSPPCTPLGNPNHQPESEQAKGSKHGASSGCRRRQCHGVREGYRRQCHGVREGYRGPKVHAARLIHGCDPSASGEKREALLPLKWVLRLDVENDVFEAHL